MQQADKVKAEFKLTNHDSTLGLCTFVQVSVALFHPLIICHAVAALVGKCKGEHYANMRLVRTLKLAAVSRSLFLFTNSVD
jgi:hypothetical protein